MAMYTSMVTICNAAAGACDLLSMYRQLLMITVIIPSSD